MGPMVLFFLGYVVLILLQKALQRCERCSTRVGRVNSFLKRSLYYTSFITVVLEGYQVIALSVTIGLYSLKWDSLGTST